MATSVENYIPYQPNAQGLTEVLLDLYVIEGLIKKINLENEDNHKIILTGGNANFFKNMFENVHLIDDLFTSRGLHYLINEFDK